MHFTHHGSAELAVMLYVLVVTITETEQKNCLPASLELAAEVEDEDNFGLSAAHLLHCNIFSPHFR